MFRAMRARHLGVAVFAGLAAFASGAQIAGAQALPPGFPPGVYPPPTYPTGPAAGCFNESGSIALMAGESATATFMCQAPSGGQVSLRVTAAPRGVTATVAPGPSAGAFVLTAK